MIRWQPMTGPIGAECPDLDFRTADPEALASALYEHQLLVLRGQSLDPDSFTKAAAGLGALDVYPYAEPMPGNPHVVAVVKEPGDESNFGGDWHTDTAYVAEPPAVTLLLAVEVPPSGGDTLFADTAGAFERCSDGFKQVLRGLSGHNTASLVHAADGGHRSVTGQSVALKAADRATETAHPLVVAHPETGREALFFSLIHTSHLTGMTRPESLPLLNALHRRVIAPENVTRLRWEPGTLAIWDNRSVQHYPLNDYGGQRREMHRIILKGDRPAGRRPVG